MDFSGVKSIESLFNFIDNYSRKEGLTVYPSSNYYYQSKDHWLGKWYYDDKDICYYFCLEFKTEPTFGIYIKPSWKYDHSFNERVKKAIKNKEITTIEKSLSSFYEDKDWGLGVFLDSNKWGDFFLNKKTELEVQQEILESFFCEVIETCRDCLA